MQLVMDVAGMTAAEADEVRRTFARPNNGHLIVAHRQRFMEGARRNGVAKETAQKIFEKINGQYMFPESHSHAFGVTAYQAAWLKRYHPLEFFVGLINNQPMGFYPVETLKQDARRFGVPFLNPCVNVSREICVPENGSVRLGLQFIRDVGKKSARLIVRERESYGPYVTAGDLVRRTGLRPQAVLSLVMAGAFDRITPNRREALWEAGLHPRPSRNGQIALPASMDDSVPRLDDFTGYDKMIGEYRVMSIYPKGHLMEYVRPGLASNVLPAAAVEKPMRQRNGHRGRLARGAAAPARPRWHRVRDHRGRDGRCSGHRLARPLREAPQAAQQPGDRGHRTRLQVGRHHQRHSHRPARRPHRRSHAALPRLALKAASATRRKGDSRIALPRSWPQTMYRHN